MKKISRTSRTTRKGPPAETMTNGFVFPPKTNIDDKPRTKKTTTTNSLVLPDIKGRDPGSQSGRKKSLLKTRSLQPKQPLQPKRPPLPKRRSKSADDMVAYVQKCNAATTLSFEDIFQIDFKCELFINTFGRFPRNLFRLRQDRGRIKSIYFVRECR